MVLFVSKTNSNNKMAAMAGAAVAVVGVVHDVAVDVGIAVAVEAIGVADDVGVAQGILDITGVCGGRGEGEEGRERKRESEKRALTI